MRLDRIIQMSISNSIAILFAFVITQAVAYFSSKSVLGAEAGWKVNCLLGLGCMVTIWGPVYSGLFAQSLILWLTMTVIGVFAIVYSLRRRAKFLITIKQGLLIFWGVTARILITAAVLGAIARGLTFIIKGVGVTPGSQ
jgi:hypothetical protein